MCSLIAPIVDLSLVKVEVLVVRLGSCLGSSLEHFLDDSSTIILALVIVEVLVVLLGSCSDSSLGIFLGDSSMLLVRSPALSWVQLSCYLYFVEW